MLWPALAGTLVLNEVLYDPPGPDAAREFVEILNVSDTTLPLAGLEIEMGDGARPASWRSAWRGASGAIGPGEIVLVAGDSIAAPYHLAFELQNGPDAVRLRRDAVVFDRLGWGNHIHAEYYESHPAADVSGTSLARLPDGRDGDDNALDFASATPTPGRRNQPLRALRVQLELPDPVRAWPGRRLVARARLRNIGVEALEAQAWALRATLHSIAGEPYRDSVRTGAAWPLDIAGATLALAPGDSTSFDVAWTAGLGLFQLHADAVANGADSTQARSAAYVRIGAGPVLVNEILYAPAPDELEWIELWNRDARPHLLDGWTLTDASGRTARLRAPRALDAGTFAIVAPDTVQAIANLDASLARFAATPWPSLNATDGAEGWADQLVLRDKSGVVQDALQYSGKWGGERGRSIERLLPDPDVRGLAWAACKSASKSTPGQPNSAGALPLERFGLDVSPNPFSPDGDGRDDAVAIRVEVPQGCEGFRASLFDLEGRRRLVLGADRLGPGPRHLFWDGADARHLALPSGVYLLHIELYANSGPDLQARRAIGLVRR